MLLTSENGIVITASCESCGNEIKTTRNLCENHQEGYRTLKSIECSCGQISNKIKKTSTHAVAVDEEKQVCCPSCNSHQFFASNKGFGLGKAAIGGMLLGPVGLLGGAVGSKKVVLTCLQCGHKWELGK